MLMLGDKKKLATIIVGKLSKDKSDDKPETSEVDTSKPETDNDIALEAAADDLMDALERKDAKAVSRALCAHYQLSMDSSNDDAEQE